MINIQACRSSQSFNSVRSLQTCSLRSNLSEGKNRWGFLECLLFLSVFNFYLFIFSVRYDFVSPLHFIDSVIFQLTNQNFRLFHIAIFWYDWKKILFVIMWSKNYGIQSICLLFLDFLSFETSQMSWEWKSRRKTFIWSTLETQEVLKPRSWEDWGLNSSGFFTLSSKLGSIFLWTQSWSLLSENCSFCFHQFHKWTLTS